MQQAFMCSYCPTYSRTIFTEEETIEHEKTCVWNPEYRHCLSCKNYGTVNYIASDDYGNSWLNTRSGCVTKRNPMDETSYMHDCQFYKAKKGLEL